MRKLIEGFETDIAVLFFLVLALLAVHLFYPADELIGRLAGEGFAALLALIRGVTRREA